MSPNYLTSKEKKEEEKLHGVVTSDNHRKGGG